MRFSVVCSSWSNAACPLLRYDIFLQSGHLHPIDNLRGGLNRQRLVRKMILEDVFFVNRLSRQMGFDLSEAQTKTQLESILSNKEQTACVATINGTVAGWVHAFKPLYIESLPFVEIGGLAVVKHTEKMISARTW